MLSQYSPVLYELSQQFKGHAEIKLTDGIQANIFRKLLRLIHYPCHLNSNFYYT